MGRRTHSEHIINSAHTCWDHAESQCTCPDANPHRTIVKLLNDSGQHQTGYAYTHTHTLAHSGADRDTCSYQRRQYLYMVNAAAQSLGNKNIGFRSRCFSWQQTWQPSSHSCRRPRASSSSRRLRVNQLVHCKRRSRRPSRRAHL